LPELIRLMRSLQPIRAYLARLTARETQLNALILETTDETLLATYQAELAEIAANRAQLAAIRAQFVADRARFIQNRQERIDTYLASHPRIAQRIHDRITTQPTA